MRRGLRLLQFSHVAVYSIRYIAVEGDIIFEDCRQFNTILDLVLQGLDKKVTNIKESF